MFLAGSEKSVDLKLEYVMFIQPNKLSHIYGKSLKDLHHYLRWTIRIRADADNAD